MKKEKVLIVGGGFGGLKAALELCDNAHFQVTLLTDRENFRYYPTLYHTATGGSRANSEIPLSKIFTGKRISIHIGKAVSLDRAKKVVITAANEAYEYDTLILALGVITNFFGIPGLQELAYGIKSNDDALKLKQHLHQQLLDEKKPDLNYLIVGGGPTGIEIASALPAYLDEMIRKHGLGERRYNVRIIEAAPRLLPRLPKSTSRAVKRRLTKLGVKLHLGKVVQGQTADALMVDGRPIRSHTVIWTAGVTNHPFFSENKFILMNRGKVATDVFLQAEPDVFVIGDNANTPFSGLAETAISDGAFVARNLKRRSKGKEMRGYDPKTPVCVIPAGKRWAAVSFRKWHLNGILGWMLREAADFVAFKDLESWPAAARQWSTEFIDEETCPFCQQA